MQERPKPLQTLLSKVDANKLLTLVYQTSVFNYLSRHGFYNVCDAGGMDQATKALITQELSVDRCIVEMLDGITDLDYTREVLMAMAGSVDVTECEVEACREMLGMACIV